MRNGKFIFTLVASCLAVNLIMQGPEAHAIDAKNSVAVAWESNVRSYDPRFAVDANSQYLEDLLHCSLLTFGPGGETAPSLAVAMPKWTNDKTLEIKINTKAKFSDGKSVTADDVVATYQYFIDPKGKEVSPRAGAFADLVNVKKTGADAVQFTLKHPDATFVTNLIVGIVPAKLASLGPITGEQNVVGCGPFSIESAGVTELALKRNPHYSLGSTPKPERVVIKYVKDEKTRFAKLRKGEVDLVQNALNRDLLKDLDRKYPELSVQRQPGLKTTYLGFNMRDKLTGNPAVRQAIARAIDRQVIIDYILAGLATPATTMLLPSDPFYAKGLAAPKQDLKEAETILDRAGLKPQDGKKHRFELSYKTTTDVTRINIAKAIATQLGKIGIKVNVEPMEWGRFKADVEAGRVQLWGLTWIGFKDPDIYRYAFATESFPPNGGNRGWYSNAKLDKLLTEGRETTDLAARKKIYADVQKLVAEDLPYVFLWHEENFVVHNKKLEGFELYADGRYSALTKVHK